MSLNSAMKSPTRFAMPGANDKELAMTDTDQAKENEVLRRMLATKPKPHKDEGKKSVLGRRRSRETTAAPIAD